jgi:superfamily II DNA or RNA helicase
MLARARRRIADDLLGPETPWRIGEITLHPHQQRAAHRLDLLMRIHGGAMLADATGLGKTFVALAIAARFERVLVVAPASLADAWRRSTTRTGVNARFISFERLSRGLSSGVGTPELVIIDEAHHLRNTRTRRYAAAAELCDRTQVLLLTATPLQNHRSDLVAQLALFLGDAAYTASDIELVRLIVRRSSLQSQLERPDLRGPIRVELPVVDDLLDEILALPPALPGADEGEAAALVSYSLLRQWSSSRAAFLAALRRRLAKALALTASLEAGRWPTRDELAAWSCAGEAMQLALPVLLAPGRDEGLHDTETLLSAVRAHSSGLKALIGTLRDTPDPDVARADTIAAICQRHPGARVLAFSQYAETVHALSRLLITKVAGVAALTASGGRVVGGRLSRRDVLAQFTPGSGASTRRAERIALLVTTDVLSEGLDLQEASVVVHLDLPWNPARLEQRVGRVRRIGSTHREIFIYALAPPAASERVLRVESRLRSKLRAAAQIVGLDANAIERATAPSVAPPELTSRALAVIEQWRGGTPAVQGDAPSTACATVLSPNDGLLALVVIRGEPLLLAAVDNGPVTTDPAVTTRLVELAAGTAISSEPLELTNAREAIRACLDHWAARRDVGGMSAAGAQIRRRVAALISELLAAVPRHRRSTLVSLASAARHGLRVPFGAGAERSLAVLARAERRDASWLQEIAALATGRQPPPAQHEELALRALIIFRAERPSRAELR